jgi:hypothetical protein
VNFLQFGEFFLFLVTILSFLLLDFLVVGGGGGGCCGGFVFGFGFCDFLLVGVGCCYRGYRV